MVHRQHGALAGDHLQGDIGRGGDLAGPGPGGVDHQVGVNLNFLVLHQVAADCPANARRQRAAARRLALALRVALEARAAFAQQPDGFVVHQHLRAVLARRGGVQLGGEEGIGGPIRHAEAAPDLRVEQRLFFEHLRQRHLFHRDAGLLAACHEALGVSGVVFRGEDEEAAGIFDALRHDAAQDAVLFDALMGRLRVFDRIAPAGVQQAVVAPAGAVAQVAPFDQHGLEAAHRQVARQAGARRAAADDEDFSLDVSHSYGTQASPVFLEPTF